MAEPEKAAEQTAMEDRRDASPGNQMRRSIFGVPVTVTISIGQQRMSVSDLLELRADSIVPLTASIDDPVELLVDKELIARGELIETEEGGLGFKITEISERGGD